MWQYFSPSLEYIRHRLKIMGVSHGRVGLYAVCRVTLSTRRPVTIYSLVKHDYIIREIVRAWAARRGVEINNPLFILCHHCSSPHTMPSDNPYTNAPPVASSASVSSAKEPLYGFLPRHVTAAQVTKAIVRIHMIVITLAVVRNVVYLLNRVVESKACAMNLLSLGCNHVAFGVWFTSRRLSEITVSSELSIVLCKTTQSSLLQFYNGWSTGQV